MNVLYVLVPVALVLVTVAIGAFVWSARRGQFDDLVTPAIRALHDDPPAPERVAGTPGAAADEGSSPSSSIV